LVPIFKRLFQPADYVASITGILLIYQTQILVEKVVTNKKFIESLLELVEIISPLR
jgi:hypothetical protein